MDERQEKYTRSQLDNPYRRNTAPDSFKNRQFNGYRVTTDKYTGEKIYYSSTGVNSAKDAARHYTTKTTANVDHIQPIDVFNERYAGKLSAEDARRIVNSDYNLALTNEALNKAKGGSTNAQYLYKQFRDGTPENITTSINMLSSQVEADVHIEIEVEITKFRRQLEAKTQSQNAKRLIETTGKATSETIHTGASAALVSLTVSGLNNLAYIASGKKDLKSALRDVGRDTANSAVSAAGMDATQKIISGIADKAGAKPLATITKQQLPIAEIALANMIAGSVSRYLDGEISGEDCVIEIFLNGAGTYAYQLGMLLGGPAGAIATSVVVTQIANVIVEYRQMKKITEAREAEINNVLREAMSEIVSQRTALKEYFEAEKKRWDDTIDYGFSVILSSALEWDPSGITDGLNMILSLFDQQVLFPTTEGFVQALYSDEPIIL